MTSGETEFQFELNETLYFDDGYHVQELLSIAVDPEITIHPYDTYVSIRGKIELQGEYIKEQEKPTEEEFTLDLEDFQAKRLIEKVSANENNHMEFSHRFPVEISIPSYRIQAIDDIHVEIVNFDYEFPTSNQLNLTALAVIHGMKEEFDLLEGKRKKIAESELEVPELPTFEFEIKKREKDEEKEETIQNSDNEIVLSKINEEQRTDEKLELDLEQPNERTEEKLAANQQEEKLIYKEEQRGKVEEPKEPVIEIEAEINEEDETIKDVGYLADMFRGNDEENYSRMRICIVQEDDTIETIAERFEISTLQLIKQNKLEEDFDINEGQLLYIPKK